MKVTAKLQLTREQQGQLMRDLNRLHGYENGLVPLDDLSTPEHLEAAYDLPRWFGQEVMVEVQVEKDGRLRIMGLATNDRQTKEITNA